MKPPMPYSGGKQRIADWIVQHLPDHEGYVEPFAGALSVLLAKPPSRLEVVNDLNHALITFWRVLRDRPQELERACALTPHSREETRLSGSLDGVDEVEVARRVWVALTQHRAAVMRPTAGWRFVHGSNRFAIADYLSGYVARIAPAAERLRRVSLECRDALDVIDAYGAEPSNFLYVDPPYIGETRSMSTGQYQCEMASVEDHGDLLSALLSCRSAVAISGYSHPMYEAMLYDWWRYEAPTTSAMGSPRVEVLWVNRPPADMLPGEW